MEPRTSRADILIVDDEIGPRESLRMILKPTYKVHCAQNGYEAIRVIQQTKMDIVILDIRMPGISGIDTLKEMKGIDPGLRVIIITASGNVENAFEAHRCGAFAYILKPFNVPEVLGRIEEAVQQRLN